MSIWYQYQFTEQFAIVGKCRGFFSLFAVVFAPLLSGPPLSTSHHRHKIQYDMKRQHDRGTLAGRACAYDPMMPTLPRHQKVERTPEYHVVLFIFWSFSQDDVSYRSRHYNLFPHLSLYLHHQARTTKKEHESSSLYWMLICSPYFSLAPKILSSLTQTHLREIMA